MTHFNAFDLNKSGLYLISVFSHWVCLCVHVCVFASSIKRNKSHVVFKRAKKTNKSHQLKEDYGCIDNVFESQMWCKNDRINVKMISNEQTPYSCCVSFLSFPLSLSLFLYFSFDVWVYLVASGPSAIVLTFVVIAGTASKCYEWMLYEL